MDREELIKTLSTNLPTELATDLGENFLALKEAAAAHTFGGAAPGKFVETLVQSLQFLDVQKYERKPDVDDYLKNLESRPSTLSDDLRICTSRIGRAMYTLRNKRNIAHKGIVDPNSSDLRFLYASAQWVLAELIRNASGITMEAAGAVVAQIQEPIPELVQRFGDRRVVLHDLTAREELLVILHGEYPTGVSPAILIKSLDRRDESTVRKALKALWREKETEMVGKECVLTHKGFGVATKIVKRLIP